MQARLEWPSPLPLPLSSLHLSQELHYLLFGWHLPLLSGLSDLQLVWPCPWSQVSLPQLLPLLPVALPCFAFHPLWLACRL